MTQGSEFDGWSAGQSYEHYMGRWSRVIAAEFLTWLESPQNADWLEIGCGTGALTNTVLTKCAPKSIKATDQSPDFVAYAQSTIADPRVEFATADALSLPADDGSIDVVTSALVLNFIPDRVAALGEMRRILRRGGVLSFYVWDYPSGRNGFHRRLLESCCTRG
jgi:ubiquinone/menaquinone biosynthesis C-methylase UbiE